MKFRLSKQSTDATTTKFYVYDDTDSIVGVLKVPSEDVADLQRHWLGSATQPQASAPRNAPTSATAATASKRVIDALVAAKRPGAIAPARSQSQDPMVRAMLGVAHKNRPTQQAILRGC
jgi:hypothetical protein